MITYFYDGKRYWEGTIEFNKYSATASVKAGDLWLSCHYNRWRKSDSIEKLLRDNIESRLQIAKDRE